MAEMNQLPGASIDADAKQFLSAINFKFTDSDTWMLNFCIEKVTNTIKNECNISQIPDGLYYIAVQMIVGEFLMAKKNSGQTDGFESIDFSAVAKQIQEGDTNITFAVGDASLTPEQRIDTLIGFLLNNRKSQFVTYRCLKR